MGSIPTWQRESRRGSTVRRRLVGVTVVGVAVAVAAFSGITAASASTTTTSPGSGKSGSSTAAMKAYETCLAKHGVKLPTGALRLGRHAAVLPRRLGRHAAVLPRRLGRRLLELEVRQGREGLRQPAPEGGVRLGGGGGFSDNRGVRRL